jgi:hypothetical protein
MRGWEHWKETEWVTFFAIKTIPFMSKSYLVCSACREPLELQAVVASMLAKPTDLSALQMKLEEQQLASKSDVQRTYLLSQSEQLTARRDDAMPNPSFELTRSGMAPWPFGGFVYSPPHGQGAMPPRSAQLQR